MCKVVHEKCEKEVAKDKSLPVNSYLVTYLLEDKLTYDIVICNKRANAFDIYWDKYRENLKSIEWTDGKVNAKTWGYKHLKGKGNE
jgi:hypothetical protein